PRQAIENAAEPFGERIEHRAVVLRPRPSRRALRALRRMRAYQTPTAPEGALRCRAVASGLPGRSAGCISALSESARNLWMRRPEVKNASFAGFFSCVPAAAYSRVRLPLLSIGELASGRSATGGSPMQIMRVLLIALGLVGVSADRTVSQPSAADYPNRQVNLIVPFAPGGGTDILGRLIGQKLSDRFSKSFVVENRPGAGTVTAAVQVAKRPPERYNTMMAPGGTMALHTTLYKKLPYDPGKDLILVALVCNVPFVLVVNPALPVNSVADLVKLAKERPLSYGSGGPGAFHHLMGELLKTTFGIPMTHVPYTGTLPALKDVIAGHIQQRSRAGLSTDPGGQAARARRDNGAARRRGAGHPAARRSRRPRLRLGGLAVGRSDG